VCEFTGDGGCEYVALVVGGTCISINVYRRSIYIFIQRKYI
jgi:hypothetical protein